MSVFLVLAMVVGATDYPTKDRTFRGVDVMIDFPLDRGIRNREGKKNNQGLCVFASMSMAGDWSNEPRVASIFSKLEDGGGWPEKAERVLREYAPGVEIAQYEGQAMDFLELGLRTYRAVCCTMDTGDLYIKNGQQEIVGHMVLLVHLDAELAAIVDNNNPKVFTWMTRKEWERRITLARGKYWAYVLILPPPPPPLALLRLPHSDENGDDAPVKHFEINRADLFDDRRRGLIA